jgi:hypothetical protein
MSKLIRRIIKESIDEFDWVDNYNLGPSVRMDYSNLARALAPIIGPMEYYH